MKKLKFLAYTILLAAAVTFNYYLYKDSEKQEDESNAKIAQEEVQKKLNEESTVLEEERKRKEKAKEKNFESKKTPTQEQRPKEESYRKLRKKENGKEKNWRMGLHKIGIITCIIGFLYIIIKNLILNHNPQLQNPQLQNIKIYDFTAPHLTKNKNPKLNQIFIKGLNDPPEKLSADLLIEDFGEHALERYLEGVYANVIDYSENIRYSKEYAILFETIQEILEKKIPVTWESLKQAINLAQRYLPFTTQDKRQENKKRNWNILEALIEAGGAPALKQKNNEGKTIFHYLALERRYYLMSHLLTKYENHIEDINIVDNKNRTILYISASRKNAQVYDAPCGITTEEEIKQTLDMVKFLVETMNADTSIRNNKGWSPEDAARKVGYKDVAEYLANKIKGKVISGYWGKKMSSPLRGSILEALQKYRLT